MTIGTTQELRLEKAAPIKALSLEELSDYAGTYVSEELLDARYRLSVKKGSLMVEMRTIAPAPLEGMAPDKFVLPGYGLNAEFTRGQDGRVNGFTASIGRAAGIQFAKQ